MALTSNCNDADGAQCRRVPRLRFIYCSISATILCLGIIILISGFVVFILTTTSSSYAHIHDYPLYDSQLNHTSIIVAIALGSVGIAFILIALVFALIACFTHDSSGSRPITSDADSDSFKNYSKSTTKIYNEEDVTLLPQTPTKPRTSPANNADPYRRAPLATDPTFEPGDMNTIGLPQNPPPPPQTFVPNRHRVPPNGFSYLVNPSQIQNYHENRSHQGQPVTSPSSRSPAAHSLPSTNNNNHTQANKFSQESQI